MVGGSSKKINVLRVSSISYIIGWRARARVRRRERESRTQCR